MTVGIKFDEKTVKIDERIANLLQGQQTVLGIIWRKKYCNSAPAQDITHTSQNISLLCNKNQAKNTTYERNCGYSY